MHLHPLIFYYNPTMMNKNKYRTLPAGLLHTLIPEYVKPLKGITIPLIRGHPKEGREATGHITTATIPGNIMAPKAPFFGVHGGYRGVAL